MAEDKLETLYTKVAQKVLKDTLHVRKGDSVTVESWDNGIPFARRVLVEARALGCPAILLYEDERAYIEGVRMAPDDSVGAMGRNEHGLLSATDAYVFIPGQALGPYSRTLKPGERAKSTRYNSSWYQAAEKAGLRGARLSFGYVGKDLARILGKRVEDVVRTQLEAALVDLGSLSALAGKITPALADGAQAELLTAGARMTFSLKGELQTEDGVVDDEDRREGANMAYVPPGFVGKEVDPESAEGTVVFTDTLTELGVISKIKLQFEKGSLASWESPESAKVKKLVESSSPERRKVNFFSLGLNPKLGYGWGQDRFVAGSLSLSGFGFRGQVKKGTLAVDGKPIMSGGKLVG